VPGLLSTLPEGARPLPLPAVPGRDTPPDDPGRAAAAATPLLLAAVPGLLGGRGGCAALPPRAPTPEACEGPADSPPFAAATFASASDAALLRALSEMPCTARCTSARPSVFAIASSRPAAASRTGTVLYAAPIAAALAADAMQSELVPLPARYTDAIQLMAACHAPLSTRSDTPAEVLRATHTRPFAGHTDDFHGYHNTGTVHTAQTWLVIESAIAHTVTRQGNHAGMPPRVLVSPWSSSAPACPPRHTWVTAARPPPRQTEPRQAPQQPTPPASQLQQHAPAGTHSPAAHSLSSQHCPAS
jgi:hypothetical protein